ncbi:peptidase S28 [Xylaria sp. CBS 124048]|nr:peptidase S28 [Xylaria sp. CBS 124048]
MVGFTTAVGWLALAAGAQALKKSGLPIRELKKQIRDVNSLKARDTDPELLYPAFNLSTPIDHFHNDSIYEPHSDGFYNMRYWFDAQYYKPGGPVFVLCSGEDSGVDRLPYLQKGIIHQLAEATNGLGVVLEHRYYGTSFPTPDLSTENLRFLTTDQALADTAYFAENVKFAGLEHIDFSPENTPYIAYGGSYAGSFVAILRKQYPETYFGAISSSGVPEAIWDYWKYFEAAATFGPQDCVHYTQKITDIIDKILIGKKGTPYVGQLKSLFGLPNVTVDGDFASTINGGIYGLQSLNWDPAVSDNEFFDYCDVVSSNTVMDNSTESLRESATELMKVAGYGDEVDSLINHLLNYIGFYAPNIASCTTEDQDSCFGTNDPSFYAQDDLSQSWRSWPYQYCTQWGFLQTGSGVPANQLPLISRTVDLEYSSLICRDAFNLTKPADVNAILKYGGAEISYPRLALMNGEWDPWRAAGTHAIGLKQKPSTKSEPNILIPQAVHHYDENGLFPNQTTSTLPPASIVQAQSQEAAFVKEWLKEFKKPGHKNKNSKN